MHGRQVITSIEARQYNAMRGVAVARTPLNCATMIPSSARRTLIFLLLSVLVFWGPDWLVPTAWEHDATYPLVSNLYQGLLVIAGFWFGPVVDEVSAGPLHQAIDQVLDELNTQARQWVI
jgi:hypothetical protein